MCILTSWYIGDGVGLSYPGDPGVVQACLELVAGGHRFIKLGDNVIAKFSHDFLIIF